MMENNLSAWTILAIIAGYFILLMMVAHFTSAKTDNNTFFVANRDKPWWVVAFGMIGASLSGVTFISVPGAVSQIAFSYIQVCLGYLLGYVFIVWVLMPLYYKHKLISIYSYLGEKIGPIGYKTGAAFFLLSRTVGTALRLYLVVLILDAFVLRPLNVPFIVTVILVLALIWLYTYRSGINTVVYTDNLLTTFILASLVATIYYISSSLGGGVTNLFSQIAGSPYSKIFHFDGGWTDSNFFFKQFISGALITIAMTGMDQDLMQKNLTCKTLRHSQTNIITYSLILFVTNVLFVALGALLYLYAQQEQIVLPQRTDELYPTIALQYLPAWVGVTFILGLTAASFASADSAMTSLTTSFCIDFLKLPESNQSESAKEKTRKWVHVGVSILMLLMILYFKLINDRSIIDAVLKYAGYTYGPLLGLFLFAILVQRKVRDQWVPFVCIGALILTVVADKNDLFIGFKLGYLNLALNGLLTIAGLFLISRPKLAEN